MAQPKQSFIISINSGFDAEARIAIGNEAIRTIVIRTKKGIDKFGAPFKPYSKEYKKHIDFKASGKSNKVNLTLTGETLTEMEILSHGPGFITIGYKDQTANDKAFFAKQGRNGFREFLGLTPAELNTILARFNNRLEQSEPDLDSLAEEIIQGLIRFGT